MENLNQISDWKEYEYRVHVWLAAQLPGATVTRNVRLPAKGSRRGRKRQIDTLIEQDFLGSSTKWICIVDAKNHKRKLHVRHVDTFLSILEDVHADRGILVSRHGFYESAYERAEGTRVQLLEHVPPSDDLNGFMLLPTFGQFAVQIRVPASWLGSARVPGDLSSLLQCFIVPEAEASKALEADFVITVAILRLWETRDSTTERPTVFRTMLDVQSQLVSIAFELRPDQTVIQNEEDGIVYQHWRSPGDYQVTALRKLGGAVLQCSLIARHGEESLRGNHVKALQHIVRHATALEMFGVPPEQCAARWNSLTDAPGIIFHGEEAEQNDEPPLIAPTGLVVFGPTHSQEEDDDDAAT